MAADTKEQILDAAEMLFAEHGIAAVPLRKIIAEADVNSAAIHYHFGSKEELVKAVFGRRFDPLNRERIELLGRVMDEAGSGPVAIEDILYALVAPPMKLGSGTEEGARFRRLAGRIFTERPGSLESVFKHLFRELETRFDAACRQALPDLPDKERAWRKHLAVGSMIYILREHDWICQSTGGLCDASDVDNAIARMVQFMAAGMKAPVLDGLDEPRMAVVRSGEEGEG